MFEMHVWGDIRTNVKRLKNETVKVQKFVIGERPIIDFLKVTFRLLDREV